TVSCCDRIVAVCRRAKVALAPRAEQATNVLLVLARKRGKRHGANAAAGAGEHHIAVVNPGEFGGVLLSRDFVPVAHLRHEPRSNETGPLVIGAVRIWVGRIAWGQFRFWGRGAERGGSLFYFFFLFELANQL